MRNSVLGSAGTNDESLLGTDSNKNGIRDDIDDYIQKRFPKSEKRRAALSQYARDYQIAFTVYTDAKKLKESALEIERTIYCLGAIFDNSGVSIYETNNLLAEIFSNKARSEAGIHIDALLWDLPSDLVGPHDELKQCRFDLKKMVN